MPVTTSFPVPPLEGSNTTPYHIVAWGDSMTFGYAPYIKESEPGWNIHNEGVPGETSTQIKDRMVAGTALLGLTTVICVGTVDYNGPAEQTIILQNIATMVAALPDPKRFLIVSAFISADYPYPGATNDALYALNSAMASAYPDNYLDVNQYIVDSYNPSLPQDVIDFGNKVTPTSLRSDAIHLNSAGNSLAGNYIANWIESNLNIPGLNFVRSTDLADVFSSPPEIGRTTPALATFKNVTLGDNARDLPSNVSLHIGASSDADDNQVVTHDAHGVQPAYRAVRSNGTVDSPTAIVSGDVMYSLQVGFYTSNTGSGSPGYVQGQNVMQVEATANATTATLALRIQSLVDLIGRAITGRSLKAKSVIAGTKGEVIISSFSGSDNPMLSFMNDAETNNYHSIEANVVSGEIRSSYRSGGYFPTWVLAGTERMRISTGGKLLVGTSTDDTINTVQVSGNVKATQFRQSANGTAPASATATGALGEIRFATDTGVTYVYYCIATNTWVRAALATW